MGLNGLENLNEISKKDMFKYAMFLYFTNSNNAYDTFLLNFHKCKISRALIIR